MKESDEDVVPVWSMIPSLVGFLIMLSPLLFGSQLSFEHFKLVVIIGAFTLILGIAAIPIGVSLTTRER